VITLAGAGRDRLAIFLRDEPEEVAGVLRSLLNVRENRNRTGFYIPIHDFPILRERLDRLGVTGPDRREMDDNAALAVRSYTAAIDRNDRLKAGEFNGDVAADLADIRSTLWTDQIADVRFIVRHARVGVFSEMGVGKSLTALAGFAVLRARGLARYCLVVSPNSVKQNWIRQTTQHTGMTVAELGNGRDTILAKITKQAKKRTDILVVHYEALRPGRSKPGVNPDEVRDRLVELPFDMVICDEVHRCKNLDTDTTKAVIDLLGRVRPAVELAEAEILMEDGTLTTAIVPASAQVGQEVDFL